tara:strand:+ start:163 stop:1059 length:897 start_codon:yes stop_codon:yes gene_type:complete
MTSKKGTIKESIKIKKMSDETQQPGEFEAQLRKPLKLVPIGKLIRHLAQMFAEKDCQKYEFTLSKDSKYDSVVDFKIAENWGYCTNMSISKFDEELKKAKRRDKKKAARFEAKGGDGNKLKQPRNAYQLFCADSRAQLKVDNPDASVTDLSTILGEAWGKLEKDENDKYQEYQESAAKLKTDYYAEIERQKQVAIENCEWEEDKPKRPTNVFFIYSGNKNILKKIKNKKMSPSETTKYLSVQWGKLSDEAKKPYYEELDKKKEKYEKEMIAYNKRQVERRKRKEEREAGEDVDADDED